MKCSVNFSDKYTGLTQAELIAYRKSLTRQRNLLLLGMVLIASTMIAITSDQPATFSVIFAAVLLPVLDKKERAIKQVDRLIEK